MKKIFIIMAFLIIVGGCSLNMDKINNTPTKKITEISDSTLSGFLNAHILLFAGYDETTGKYTNLINNNNEKSTIIHSFFIW